MLLILAILYLLQGLVNTDAAPLSTIFPRHTDIGSSLSQNCVCPNTRSVWDIVWSCLVTIFACSWVSVHPNIPESGEGGWKKALRRLELMFWSIILPELIIYWALKQWTGARFLAKKYSKDGWTKTHGFFIQMGGFILYDGNKVMGVLGPQKLNDLLGEKKIAMPTITGKEIKDRSKGDGLSKILVIVQTTWFIVQCIARRVRGLTITELELATLAFATLNTVMYAFWWNKPLDVTTTVPVHLLKPTSLKPSVSAEPLDGGSVEVEMNSQGQFMLSEMKFSLKPPSFELPGGVIDLQSLICSPELPARLHRAINNLKLRDLGRQTWWLVSGILFRWPAAGIVAVVSRISDITGANLKTIREGKMRVNTFYAYHPFPGLDSQWGRILLPLTGILFGAIHCAGWNFFFPSLAEANIWRVSSTVITVVPTVGLMLYLLHALNILYYKPEDNFLVLGLSRGLAVLLGVMLPVYVLARLALLVEALISLRYLQPGALAAVEWTSFIPHI